MLRDEGGFQKAFREILEDELHMSLLDFSEASGISQSTLYKILEEQREPRLPTVRQIIKTINRISNSSSERFLAVIATSKFIEGLPKSLMTETNGQVSLREYPVSTVEDAIISAVRAERDGALGIICAPIVATTIEKLLSIKVYTVAPLDSVINILDTVKGDF